ncbi:hypothetical protein GIB67_041674 [Kingdonia uniflora]|uniref:Uncharacterized protein n=1 Tax=Kingdonia uniflora TaxID=39325 RepID=A0A7J7MQQ4_9MAGN|nr:hypothetical protein GIB67_041674 [Kingdonia uniflora]
MRLGALNLIELRETQRRNHASFENQTLIFIISIYLCNLRLFDFYLQSSSSQFQIGKFIGLDSSSVTLNDTCMHNNNIYYNHSTSSTNKHLLGEDLVVGMRVISIAALVTLIRFRFFHLFL